LAQGQKRDTWHLSPTRIKFFLIGLTQNDIPHLFQIINYRLWLYRNANGDGVADIGAHLNFAPLGCVVVFFQTVDASLKLQDEI